MRQRSSYSKSFKTQVVQECLQPGISIASVALRHGINANLVRKTAYSVFFISALMLCWLIQSAKAVERPRSVCYWFVLATDPPWLLAPAYGCGHTEQND